MNTLQRLRSVDGGGQVRGLGANPVIELSTQLRRPPPGMPGVADIGRSAPDTRRREQPPRFITDAVAFSSPSDFRLLGDLESVIDFNPKVPYHRLQLRVPEE